MKKLLALVAITALVVVLLIKMVENPPTRIIQQHSDPVPAGTSAL